MLYSCNHMATVGFKGLTATRVIIHHTAQFSSISSIVLRGKVSEKPVWKNESWALLEPDWGVKVKWERGSRELELQWRSSAFRDALHLTPVLNHGFFYTTLKWCIVLVALVGYSISWSDCTVDTYHSMCHSCWCESLTLFHDQSSNQQGTVNPTFLRHTRSSATAISPIPHVEHEAENQTNLQQQRCLPVKSQLKSYLFTAANTDFQWQQQT